MVTSLLTAHGFLKVEIESADTCTSLTQPIRDCVAQVQVSSPILTNIQKISGNSRRHLHLTQVQVLADQNRRYQHFEKTISGSDHPLDRKIALEWLSVPNFLPSQLIIRLLYFSISGACWVLPGIALLDPRRKAQSAAALWCATVARSGSPRAPPGHAPDADGSGYACTTD
jgi:hypothetical protein